jgi:glycosyltransferase involved in cell wall biosynthesis
MRSRLTVTIPTFNTPTVKLDRAVRSVVESLPADGRVVVINDGGRQPSLWPDKRVSLVDLHTNRGRYFADAVVLATLDEDEFWSPHDDDDWSEPDRFGPLIEMAVQSGAVVAPMWRHEILQKPRVQPTDFSKVDSPTVRHIAHWCTGVYRVSRVRDAGGLLLNVRTSYDHCLLLSLAKAGPMVVCRDATYHWERRPGSLTTARETSVGSAYRAQERKLVDGVWRLIREGHDPFSVVEDASGETLRLELQAEVSRLSSIA